MKTHISGLKNSEKIIEYAAFFLMAMSANSANSQETIISVSGPPDTTRQFSGLFAVDRNLSAISWITTSAFTNVSISIELGGDSGAIGEAFLTTQIGPGTITADQIAASSFSFPAIESFTPVLSGLTLEAGTNYLLIEQTAAGSSGGGVWEGTPAWTVETAAGVTANYNYWTPYSIPSYAPAADFSEISGNSLQYAIIGEPIPEPSTAWLVLFGGGVAFLGRWRNRIGFWRSRQPQRRGILNGAKADN